ncbi:uncharacterized protein BX664DRAFT_322180 [Halteromyces radiatus]|uniref:uncharacterized protein n=1 Tax=Halteromyces radiatus TaxID=101107 RepID=UPI0022206540|nr:uncharacterized protein BX664DRAFT_322180 [Halteromyces radiatus]KAI8099811.1 hypothetical protein BX664DRAFT_322180 [Halteromyces radiatus]
MFISLIRSRISHSPSGGFFTLCSSRVLQQRPTVNSSRYIGSSHCEEKTKKTSCCHGDKKQQDMTIFSKTFWMDSISWKRTRVNTLRCLIGCTTGDFATMWYLQYYYPTISPMISMTAAVAAGLTTSLALETVLLKRTIPGIGYMSAFKTAMEMSFASMIAMEMAENIVDWHLMGGQVIFDDPKFWMAALISTGAGYLVPLPYNYWRLKALGKACH